MRVLLQGWSAVRLQPIGGQEPWRDGRGPSRSHRHCQNRHVRECCRVRASRAAPTVKISGLNVRKDGKGCWPQFASTMRFHSLPAQVADYLRAEIARGRWTDSLPGERALAETLHVSRRTLTAALAQLQQAGMIKSEPARGHRIVPAPRQSASGTLRQIGLLTPDPLDAMRPGTTLWVNDLQALLVDADFRLSFFHGRKYVSRHPNRALARLVSSNPQAGWLLAGSSEPTQRWFARSQLRAVVVGTCHGGVVLPDVDLDFHAMGRHLAGRLAAHRHRRAALFLTNSPGYFTSEAETERGFRQVLQRAGAEAIGVYHERTRDGLVRVLRRLFSFSGASLVADVIGAGCKRCEAGAVETYLDSILPLLDVDDNDVLGALTDGLLIVRRI